METKDKRTKKAFNPADYKIETGIPVPENAARRHSPRRLFLMGLKVDDTFLFPIDELQSFSQVAKDIKKADKTFNYTIARANEMEYRFWREAPEQPKELSEEIDG